MSTYLDKLIESVEQEINQEHKRVAHITFHTKKKETQAAGTLRRLEQRLEVLERLRAKETVTAGHHMPRGDGKERISQFEALKRRRTTPVSPRVG
jgi:hypothetical protein